jgi:DNA-directed RNA polymerase|tara:strand:+ start:2869 stop:5211 length:2343 start_codon:yes stop_codon:yes gene_type:complete
LATKAEIHEQVELEREQIRQGLKQLHDNQRKLEDKEYASASVYGVASIEQLLPLVVGRIQETALERIKKGKNGRSFVEIQKYLSDIEPEAAAAIACKVTFDKVFSNKPKANQVQSVTEAIGQAVENECMMRHYERKVPGLLHTLKENYFHRSIGTHQKVKVITTLMNRYDVPHWECWGRANRIKLGSWLIDCIIEASGWFTREMRQEGRKRHNYIIPSTHFLSIKEEVMATAELFSPLAWPMLIEPNDWTNERQGGYLLNEVMRGYDMVRRADPRCIQGETPINFLNKIQKVGYTLNPFIVGVAETLLERGIQVGKFIPIVELPLPPKPYDIAENKKARHDYNRKAAEVHNTNAQAFQRSCRTRMTMNAVKVFKDKEKFFIPWSFDYRGRAYPIPAFLTPQDTDFGKSLLKFYEQSFMTPEAEQWLAFQVATTYGKDKDTMSDRLDWVAKNHNLISRIAEDPISNRPEWEGAEEPWTFLAACDEYYHCVIKCDRTHTSLPVAVDATCSGLQILAGLARDASTARLVNVLPSDKPQDAYKVIAEEAKPHVPECIRPYMDRKTTKRTVMTVPYNAKPYSNRGYIREALLEKGVEVEKDDLTATVKAVRDAMNVIVPGPMQVMRWIESEVAAAIDRGATELQWVTPSGFVVTQKLMKKKVQEIELQLLGRCHIRIATEDDDKVDKSHHKNATAPNLIHSLDASLLHLSALRFDAPISLIHDSVLCRATDMSVLSAIVRETYMHLFAEHNYLTTFAQCIGAETEPPMCNTLEPASVIESTYFFC